MYQQTLTHTDASGQGVAPQNRPSQAKLLQESNRVAGPGGVPPGCCQTRSRGGGCRMRPSVQNNVRALPPRRRGEEGSGFSPLPRLRDLNQSDVQF